MDKQQQRQLAYSARNAQPDKDWLSTEIFRRVLAQSWYIQAATVLWYVHCRSEVRTLSALHPQLRSDKRIAVPYCTSDEAGNKCLGLWRLESLEELVSGMWNIMEPPRQRWQESDKQIASQDLDVVLVPGVAFDAQGGRLGNGAGYYDRLLQQVRPDTALAGICFESQLLPQIVMQSHDVAMNFIITERAVYTAKAPGRA